MRRTGKNESIVILALRARANVRLATPEPELLRAIGEESITNGTDKLISRQIEQAIRAARGRKPKRG